MSWHEFRDLCLGLFACESRIWRATRPPEPTPAESDELPDMSALTY
jgi:hypothetical protein